MDEEEIEKIYGKLRKDLYNYLRSHESDGVPDEELMNIVDNAFTEAFGEEKYNPSKGKLFSYLLMMCKDDVKDWYKKKENAQRVRPKPFEDSEDEPADPVELVARSDVLPENELAMKGPFNIFHTSISKLSRAEKRAIFLTWGLRMPDKKAASLLGTRSTNIQKNRCNALLHIRNDMGSVDPSIIRPSISFEVRKDEFFKLANLQAPGPERECVDDIFYKGMGTVKAARTHKLTNRQVKDLVERVMHTIDAGKVLRKKPEKKAAPKKRMSTEQTMAAIYRELFMASAMFGWKK